MKKRKYLDKIGVVERPDTWGPNDERQKEWKKKRKKYGFDERETWSMDYTWHLWLYERLKAFRDWAYVDFNYHTFIYKDKEYTQGELIDMMLERLEFSFTKEYNDFDKEQYAYVNEIEYIWALIVGSMWW